MLRQLLILGLLSFFYMGHAQENSMQLVFQRGHSADVYSVCFSPDNKYVATGSMDKTARLWDVASAKEIRTFQESSEINDVVFSPDGRYLATAVQGGISLFDIISGIKIKYFDAQYSTINSIDFSPDGKYLISGGNDEALSLWDVNSGQKIRVMGEHQGIVNTVKFSPDGDYIASGGRDKLVKLWPISAGLESHDCRGHSGYIWTVNFSPDGKYCISGGEDYLAILWDTYTGRKVREFEGYSSIRSLCFTIDGKSIIGANADGSIVFWNTASGVEEKRMKGPESYDYSLDLSNDGIYLLSGHQSYATLWNILNGSKIRDFSGLSFSISGIDFNPDKKYFASTNKLCTKVWNLEAGNVNNGFPDWGSTCVSWHPDSNILASGSGESFKKGIVTLWDIRTGRKIKTLEEHKSAVSALDFSPDGKTLISASWDQQVIQWDVSTGKAVRSLRMNRTTCTDYITSLAFNNKGDMFGAGAITPLSYVGGGAKIWNAISGSDYYFPINPDNSSLPVAYQVGFSPDDAFFLTASGNSFRVWDVVNKTESSSFGLIQNESVSSFAIRPDGKYVVTDSKEQKLIVWDFINLRPVRNIGSALGKVVAVTFSLDGKWLLAGSDDATIRLWDFESGNLIATFISAAIDDYIVITPDGYYTTTKFGVTNFVHFVKGMNIYTFENFDLIFNRPDIVIDRLGIANRSMVNAYKKAYLNRLKKMGFTEEQISTDTHLPEVEIVSKDLPLETKQKTLTFKVRAADSEYKLDRINVYVNDVPIYGMKGLSLRVENLSAVSREFTIELSRGNNKIQISAHNEKGAESLRQTFEINYSGTAPKPDLYVIAIGTSKYVAPEFNLDYAAKDACDIAAAFGKNPGQIFNQIHTLLITDEQATREGIKKARQLVETSRVDDHVVLFVAGHGLIDENLDYYYATHNVNFYSPSQNGLPYEELENILDGIPARKKLLMMDACHSGEIEKDEMQVLASTGGSSNVKSRAVRGFKQKESTSADQQFGLINTSGLLQELFADLRRGTGATIITSSSGEQYSFESPQWNNGVFTYCILDGMNSGNADKNKDKILRISELRDYVIERVAELTSGRQTPTSRRENLEDDFQVR